MEIKRFLFQIPLLFFLWAVLTLSALICINSISKHWKSASHPASAIDVDQQTSRLTRRGWVCLSNRRTAGQASQGGWGRSKSKSQVSSGSLPSALSMQWSDLKTALLAFLPIFHGGSRVWPLQGPTDTGQMQQSVLSTCLSLSLGAALLYKARCNLLVGRFMN